MDELELRRLLSGQNQSWRARLLRAGLWVLSHLYSLGVLARNFAFDRGVLPVHCVGVPVISVGNLTTGGTGKTPLVAFLADELQCRGWRPAILSRGYGATDGGPNDERLVLERLCPTVPQAQGRDRVALSRDLIAREECDLILLDDGFQHRRLARDVDLVLIDALQPWGYGHLLPRGLMREPLAALKRASLILLTRANLAAPADLERLHAQLSRLCPAVPRLEIAFEFSGLQTLTGERLPLDRLHGQSTALFCGIGNPVAFIEQVRSLASVAATWTWPDHHRYTGPELAVLGEWSGHTGAPWTVTTLKDLVKISASDWTGPPLVAIEQRAVPRGDWSVLAQLLPNPPLTASSGNAKR